MKIPNFFLSLSLSGFFRTAPAPPVTASIGPVDANTLRIDQAVQRKIESES
jgi:hypothetical protein